MNQSQTIDQYFKPRGVRLRHERGSVEVPLKNTADLDRIAREFGFKKRTARRSVPTTPLHLEEKILVSIVMLAMGACVVGWCLPFVKMVLGN